MLGPLELKLRELCSILLSSSAHPATSDEVRRIDVRSTAADPERTYGNISKQNIDIFVAWGVVKPS